MNKLIGGCAGLAVMIGAGIAQAGLLPVNVTTKAEGGDYRYTYGIQLQSGAVLKTGDYFTIYDFDGLVAGKNTQPAGFTFSSTNTGPSPKTVRPDDDPVVSNVTWTYTGSDTIGPVELGSFSAVSHYGTDHEDSFAAQAHRQVGGQLNSNITVTQVPVPTSAMQHCHVPEPSAFLLLAAGVPLLLGFTRLRRRFVV